MRLLNLGSWGREFGPPRWVWRLGKVSQPSFQCCLWVKEKGVPEVSGSLSVLGGAIWPLGSVLWRVGGAARQGVRKQGPVLTLPAGGRLPEGPMKVGSAVFSACIQDSSSKVPFHLCLRGKGGRAGPPQRPCPSA